MKIAILYSVAGAFLASGDLGFDITPFLNFGFASIVLGWVLARLEPRMRSMEDSIDRHTRALMLFMAEHPHVIEAVKAQARSLIEEIERKNKQ